MFQTAIFCIALLKTSILASISNRRTFILEFCLMLGNNFIFFLMWWIFFSHFNEVDGWTFNDMTHLMAIGIGSYGLMLICFGGLKNLSKMIISGGLDPFITQPKNILIHLAGSKSLSKGWGHLMTSLILIFMGTTSSLFTTLLIFIGIFCGFLVFSSVNAIAHSLAFWMGPIEGLSKKYCDTLFLFVLYPANIYSGFVQIMMFTLVPGGVISYLPVELTRHFSWIELSILIGITALFVATAATTFYSGLKKYESGNQFGLRL